jgi:hypothetical protein
MDINYYKKYIKYKTKYINLQYGGMLSSGEIASVPITKYNCNQNILDKELCISDENGIYETRDICNTNCNHIWKQYYKKLYQDILAFINSDITDTNAIINLKTQFNLLIVEINKIYSASSEKLIIKYNIRFIISIISMLFDVSDVNATVNGENFNMNLAFNGKTFYYMEECYTADLDLFYKEYENLYKTQKSRFFYQSNLVNILILLKCYNDECFLKQLTQDKLPHQEYYSHLNIAYDRNKQHINDVFQTNKIELLKLVLQAYEDFDYNKIKLFYLKYLNFYYNAFTHLKKLKFVILTDKDDEDNYVKQYNKLLEIVQKSTATSNNCVVYLSAILSSEDKFIKFNTTRILIGYLGMRYNSDDFYDSIDNITHDFTTVHQQYICKISFTENELKEIQDLLKKLYIFYKGKDTDDQETIKKNTLKRDSLLKFLHLYIYEFKPFCLTINNIINLYKKFSLQSVDLYSILKNLIPNYINVTNPEQKLLTNLTEHNTKFKDVISIRKNFHLELVNKLEYIMATTTPTFEELFIDDSSNVYTHELYIFIKNILYPKILDFSRLVPSVDRISIILSICDDKYPLSIINYIIKYKIALFYTESDYINNFTELTRFLLLNGYKPQLEAAGRYYLENIQNLFPFTP